MPWSKYSITSENIGLYEEIFENITIIDCHAHIGVDKDGHRMTAKESIRMMDREKINKAVIFALNDPRDDRHFHVPNEEILLASRAYPGRFIPFFRINPRSDWQAELRLRASQGFRGIKLHPRSQNFGIVHRRTMAVYGAAEKSNLPVMLHTGFGLERIADDILKIITAFPNLRIILGHSAFPDLGNTISKIGKSRNVLFDTSTCRIFDLFDLMKKLDFSLIAFGSDMPYYESDVALQGVIDSAITVGLTSKQIRGILGGNAAKWFL